jgi:hypothetical protein
MDRSVISTSPQRGPGPASHYNMSRRAFMGWAAAGAAAAVGRPARASARARWWSSLVFGVFENHGLAEVIGLPSHRRLAEEGTLLARYFAVAHPSGPNYRALISGNTWSRNEVVDAFHPSIASLAAADTPPIPTFIYHLAGEIARRHNPFLDLRAPVAAVRRGEGAFRQDLGDTLSSPAIVYVGWDDLNNMHDGSPARADSNLGRLLDILGASPWFARPDPEGRYPALFICYDEGIRDNHVFAAWWGRGVRRGTVAQTAYTHYSFCRTVTDNWGFPALQRAAEASAIDLPWT